MQRRSRCAVVDKSAARARVCACQDDATLRQTCQKYRPTQHGCWCAAPATRQHTITADSHWACIMRSRLRLMKT
eukprot:962670-Prymnesium_polylepis.1